MTTLVEGSIDHLDFEADIKCSCRKFCSPQEHPAVWWVTLTCGCLYPMCQQALRIARIRLKARPLACRLCAADDITIRRVIALR
jgi:hypothetical protein